VFIRELVPRRAIAWVARAWYNEPYSALPMRHVVERAPARQVLRYEWRMNGEWSGLSASTEGSARPLVPGSEAEFITEHYWGYTRQRDGGTIEYQVAHPSWGIWDASGAALHGDVTATYGPEFAAALSGQPTSAFVAEGSEVVVYQPRRLSRA